MNSRPFFRIMTKTLLYAVCFIILVYVLSFILYHNVTVKEKLDSRYIDSLLLLKKHAATRTEYPVSALLIYDGSIIGKGCNIFLELNDPAGHAEINALRNAFKKIPYKEFLQLDQRKLILLTSYEPCLMCKGMCCHHGIKKVYYLQKKPAYLRWRNVKTSLISVYRVRKLKFRQDQ
jgi:tRNA(Arg) A34 adenosine deaminase TadA